MPLGTTANKQGRIAGENMAGGNDSFAGVVGTSVFRVFGLEVGRTGITEKEARREGIVVAAVPSNRPPWPVISPESAGSGSS
jgi:NADPH-dependent 2,4-dienoyl-CoA reductase/sulfur reductase-like enzyme